MKVLVDSTVWIDFFKNRPSPKTVLLEQLILNREDICICGFILTEVLQGIRDEKQYVTTKLQFSQLLYLEEDRSTFELAATLYRELRKRGITLRNSIDCLIAGLVLQQGVYFLESDRDYSFIDQHYPLHRL